jgi:hypothetical protein
MGTRLTGKLTVGCLIAVALAIPACDRTTPSGPADNNRLTIGSGVAPTYNTLTLPPPTGPVTLTEGGDVCIPVTLFTVTIVKNTRLMCDTKCETTITPCYQFGAPGIKLDLNGRRVWGPAEPPSNCEATSTFAEGDGIASFGFSDVVIEGPGLVEKFRRHGIALRGIPNPPPSPPTPLRNATVKRVTSHHNCFSGIWLALNVRETLVEDVVSVRNASASDFLPCGGLCITNSHNNRIRRSEFAGNGSIVSGLAPVAVPNDFGVGLVGNSSGNIIEENGIGGNINGILVFPGASANLIRKNVIAGNPAIQVQVGSPAVGFDIRNFSPPGANRFEENLCITSFPIGNPPCPNLPQWAGHQNNG